MVSSIFSIFQSAFVHTDKDPTAGVRQRLASMPASQAEAIVANDDLRGFLKAVFRLHEEKRIPAEEWAEIAHFLMGVRGQTPRSVLHLNAQWPGAVESWGTVRDLLRTPRAGAMEPASKTVAKLQALLAYLKQNARKQSWLSHGFHVEFNKMSNDRIAIASRRMDVLQLATTSIGPMDREQLQACRQRIAAVMELLPPDDYPCIRDSLSRLFNEANWQLALFRPPKAGTPPPSGERPLNAEACP